MKPHDPRPIASGGVWTCLTCGEVVIMIRRGTRLFWRHK